MEEELEEDVEFRIINWLKCSAFASCELSQKEQEGQEKGLGQYTCRKN